MYRYDIYSSSPFEMIHKSLSYVILLRHCPGLGEGETFTHVFNLDTLNIGLLSFFHYKLVHCFLMSSRGIKTLREVCAYFRVLFIIEGHTMICNC